MKIAKFFLTAAMASLITACGGGGGSSGTVPGATAPTADVKVANYVIELSKPSLSNSGSDSVVLTTTALDASNNPVADAVVSVAVDTGVYTGASQTTDSSGKQSGTVTIGGNKINRNITARVTLKDIVKTIVIPVTGTKISINLVPSSAVPGQLVNADISVTDANDVAIPNLPIQVSGNAGFTGNFTLDSAGKFSVEKNVPAVEGDFVVTVVAGGATVSKPIKVLGAGSTSIPAASGVVIASSLTANPAAVAPNGSGSTSNRVKLSAKFLQGGNAGIANIRVRFELTPPALGSGEYIVSGDSFVYSDGAGTAETEYVPGTRTSPTNGVNVRACYSNTDFAKGTCPASVEAKLTVNSQPLAITIGNFNKLESAQGGLIYNERFVIQVADSSGVAVADAVVSASVDITHFGKGIFGQPYLISGIQAPDMSLAYTSLVQDSNAPASATNYSPAIDPAGSGLNIWCVNEDTNRNGFLEVGEDLNGDGNLTPRKSEVVVSFVDGNRTDKSGQLIVQVSYPQNVGKWLAYTLKATTAVVGSEGSNSRSFVTNVLEADVPNGSFRTPPYGSRACNTRL